MFGVDFTELLVVVAVAIIAIGPKDLPGALYTAGKFVRKFRSIAHEVHKSIDSVMQEGELDEIVRTANKPGGENLQEKVEQQVQIEDKKNGTNS